MLFYPSSAYAADFDLFLSGYIAEKGIYKDTDGIIHASSVENDTMLAVISIENNAFTINVFGSENEPADSLSVPYSNKRLCRIGIANSPADFCITVQNDKSTVHYRLKNDAFISSAVAPAKSTTVAESKNGKVQVYTKPSEIYDLINNFKSERINHIPYEEITVTDSDKVQLLNLLRACADIYEYDSEETDYDSLMRRVLYTHKNFATITSITPQSSETNPSFKLCDEKYITSVLHNAFRKEAKRPAINMLTSIGYCYNNGYYYYIGGYTDYFRTEIHDILKIFRINDEKIYIVFSDTYTENDSSVHEYSTATAAKDKDGYYLTSLHMGGDLSDVIQPASDEAESSDISLTDTIQRFLPLVISLFALAAIGVVIYIYIIRS